MLRLGASGRDVTTIEPLGWCCGPRMGASE
jgi:hypothetical protein